MQTAARPLHLGDEEGALTLSLAALLSAAFAALALMTWRSNTGTMKIIAWCLLAVPVLVVAAVAAALATPYDPRVSGDHVVGLIAVGFGAVALQVWFAAVIVYGVVWLVLRGSRRERAL
jgi:hypothetical protein